MRQVPSGWNAVTSISRRRDTSSRCNRSTSPLRPHLVHPGEERQHALRARGEEHLAQDRDAALHLARVLVVHVVRMSGDAARPRAHGAARRVLHHEPERRHVPVRLHHLHEACAPTHGTAIAVTSSGVDAPSKHDPLLGERVDRVALRDPARHVDVLVEHRHHLRGRMNREVPAEHRVPHDAARARAGAAS